MTITNIFVGQDEEMSWLDKSCLHLAVRKKDKIETITFQVRVSSYQLTYLCVVCKIVAQLSH